MKNYRKINSERSWETIGDEISLQFGQTTAEIRFVRVYDPVIGWLERYDVYARNPGEYENPDIGKFKLVAAGKRLELQSIINAHLKISRPFVGLPKELKVVHPHYVQDFYGVFVKQS